jgi:hypothetical protein
VEIERRKIDMALVSKLELVGAERPRVHEEIAGSYCTFTDGEKTYLQITTRGSENRQIPNKVSQIIQFGPEAITQLRQILATLG